jgi:hypothetical protein
MTLSKIKYLSGAESAPINSDKREYEKYSTINEEKNPSQNFN